MLCALTIEMMKISFLSYYYQEVVHQKFTPSGYQINKDFYLQVLKRGVVRRKRPYLGQTFSHTAPSQIDKMSF